MRKLLIPAAAAVALLAVAPMTAASAASHSVLTVSRVGGPNVKVGALLKAGLKSGTKAVFETGGGTNVTCKKVMFTDQVTKNPSRPGTAIEKLKAQTFGSCTVKGITGATSVQSVKLNKLPYTTTIKDSTGNPVAVTGTNTTISINTVLGAIHCTYIAKTTKGSANNKSQTITFVKQAFKLSSGPGTCPKNGTFSAEFGPVQDTSVKGNPHVFVN
jgi:hypothetical protein